MTDETQTQTEQSTKPMFTFGLAIENTLAWYGARAIFRQNYIDIVWDRQSGTKLTEEHGKSLLDWLNNIGMPTLRLAVRNIYLPENKADMAYLEDGEFILVASTNASYGYLYIGAAMKDAGFDPLKHIPHISTPAAPPVHRIEPMDLKQIKAATKKAEREDKARQKRARNYRGW